MIDTQFLEQVALKAHADLDDLAIDMMVTDMEPVFFDRVITHIVAVLSGDELRAFEELLQTEPSDRELDAFLTIAIDQYEDHLFKIYADFEQSYLAEVERAES